MLLYSSLFTIK